jgi:hypothetical protein
VDVILSPVAAVDELRSASIGAWQAMAASSAASSTAVAAARIHEPEATIRDLRTGPAALRSSEVPVLDAAVRKSHDG